MWILLYHFPRIYVLSGFELRFKKKDETRNYLLDEIKHNGLMSKKYKKTCSYLNHVEQLLFLVSTITGSVSISASALLVWVPVGIMSSAVGIKFVQSLQELKSISQL